MGACFYLKPNKHQKVILLQELQMYCRILYSFHYLFQLTNHAHDTDDAAHATFFDLFDYFIFFI